MLTCRLGHARVNCDPIAMANVDENALAVARSDDRNFQLVGRRRQASPSRRVDVDRDPLPVPPAAGSGLDRLCHPAENHGPQRARRADHSAQSTKPESS